MIIQSFHKLAGVNDLCSGIGQWKILKGRKEIKYNVTTKRWSSTKISVEAPYKPGIDWP